MKRGLALILLALLEMASPFVASRYGSSCNRYTPAFVNADPKMRRCNQADITGALQRLSSANQSDIEQARKILLDYSRQSPACRKEVINTLISAMDRPNLDFSLDDSSYLLWREGARLLGDMKATESLDLLISHLDLNDGEFSASMVHQPAVLGVIDMGQIAVQKLEKALLHSPNRKIRLAAVLCLTAIGGQHAMSAIRQALRSETDQCVTHFMRVSLSIFGKDTTPRSHKLKRSSLTADINARRELLSSFIKCN